MKVAVGIIGAGPAGLFLSHLLRRAGIESVVLEARSRADVEGTVRAGVLEQRTVEALVAVGVGERLLREGVVHRGVRFRFGGRTHRLDLAELTGGRAITLYPQHEVLKDLLAVVPVQFDAKDVTVADLESPRIRYRVADEERELRCDFIAGCDGFHGVARAAVTPALRAYTRDSPFGWFGMLVESPPSSDEIVYASGPGGFALVSTRTPRLQRLYLQCPPADRVDVWPDERIWAELEARLVTAEDGWRLERGRIFQKSVIAIRSFVVEPMQHGRLFLAGDAAHIVPPTGAKGLNLAVNDVLLLARALVAWYRDGQRDALASYSADALPRVWQAQRFASRLTEMLHCFPEDDGFRERLQRAQLDELVSSRAAATAFAESYAG